MTLGFLVRSKNFCKLLYVSWQVFVLHGLDCIHCVAKSWTTTAYRWLCRDSHSSLRTLLSACIESPKFSALGTTVPVRLLQEVLVILVLKQKAHFRSFGKCVKMLFLPETTFAREELEASWCSGTLSSTRPCGNSCSHSGTSCDEFPRTSSVSSFWVWVFGFC